jgi:hypothetical protein
MASYAASDIDSATPPRDKSRKVAKFSGFPIFSMRA